MAKISTYPLDTNISGGDKLIGTDVNNSDATKNFTVSDLSTYIIGQAASAYVPYTGATGPVNLGLNNLTANGLVSTDGIDLTGELFTFGSAGTAGYILSSQGAGFSPQWIDGKTVFVPYTGATGAVDLGAFALAATGLNVKTGPLLANGAAGTSGDFLTSGGAGVNPTWTANPFGKNYGMFNSTTTQNPASGTIAAMEFENTVLGDGNISIVNNLSGDPTRITVGKAGTYNFQFSAQFEKTGGGDVKVSIWLRKNGVDVPNSNTHITMKASANYVAAAWNFFETLSSLQYVEIMWSHDNDAVLKYEPADIVVPHPATPSIILTVNQIA